MPRGYDVPCTACVAIALTIALIGLSALAGPIRADAPAAAGHAPLLDAWLDEVTTLSADFAQTLIDADGTVIEESAGTLEISRPGRFRWIYVEPYEQWLVADGLNVWSYDVDLEQVTVKAQSVALASTPALLLGGADDVLEDFRYEGTVREADMTWIRLAPLDDEAGFRHVELGFLGEILSRMVFRDNLEQTTIVALDNVTVNAPVDAAAFDFEVPPGVDVVGTPAARGAGKR